MFDIFATTRNTTTLPVVRRPVDTDSDTSAAQRSADKVKIVPDTCCNCCSSRGIDFAGVAAAGRAAAADRRTAVVAFDTDWKVCCSDRSAAVADSS